MRSQDRVRTGLAVVAWLFVGCIFVQIFLAGLGVFDSASAFETHRDFGYLFGWLTLVMLVLAAVGRVPRSLLGLTALALLLFALQSVFVALRSDYPAVAALHPVNGVALLLVAIVIARRATALRAVPASPNPSPSPEPTAARESDRVPTA
jgi:mercuric ion transport protein